MQSTMGNDNNQQKSHSELFTAKVHGQLAGGMSQDIKEMVSSIASFDKVMTPINNNAVIQNDQQRSMDPKMV